MIAIKHKCHAKAGPLEALAFRGASCYEPALEGLTRAFVSQQLLIEREKVGGGLIGLVRSALARFDNEGGGKWFYTKTHSLEVARFAFVMAKEAKANSVPGAERLDPRLLWAGGAAHDVGKTFIPVAILVKELGIDFVLFTAFKGSQLTDAERRIMREEHIAIGSRYVRMYGAGEHIRVMLDMVGLHHVMYNGQDSGVPSYPSLIKGSDLPLHARIAKVADFISAVKPRHYRTNGFVKSVDDAVAYAVTASGTELDPLAVACFLTGFYDININMAGSLVSRLAHPGGQAGVSDIHGARLYSKDVVRTDPEFLDLIARRAVQKQQAYDKEIDGCIGSFGLKPASLRTN